MHFVQGDLAAEPSDDEIGATTRDEVVKHGVVGLCGPAPVFVSGKPVAFRTRAPRITRSITNEPTT